MFKALSALWFRALRAAEVTLFLPAPVKHGAGQEVLIRAQPLSLNEFQYKSHYIDPQTLTEVEHKGTVVVTCGSYLCSNSVSILQGRYAEPFRAGLAHSTERCISAESQYFNLQGNFL